MIDNLEMTMKCRICDNVKENNKFIARELMFGSRDEFVYFQCADCGCLQIENIPDNISQYYPSNYYSFKPYPYDYNKPLRSFLKRHRDRYALSGEGIFGRLIYRYFPNIPLKNLSELQLRKDMRILDVGCGSGSILYALKEIGFENVLGIDPYIEKDICYKNGLKVLKKTIHNEQGEFDVIIFHDSFEHIEFPYETFHSIKKRLSPAGVCFIQIPTVDSLAWETYNVNWVQLDAPRHFFLHSKKSMGILAENCGLKIRKITYNSTEFQFWGSEQYKKDIPLYAENSFSVNPSKSIFTKDQIRSFKEKSEKLNLENKGDQAIFYIEKI